MDALVSTTVVSAILAPDRPRFCATCGVIFRFRHSATKFAVSYALSPATVTFFVPGICSGITSATWRSAVPLASNTLVFKIRRLRVFPQHFLRRHDSPATWQ